MWVLTCVMCMVSGGVSGVLFSFAVYAGNVLICAMSLKYGSCNVEHNVKEM